MSATICRPTVSNHARSSGGMYSSYAWSANGLHVPVGRSVKRLLGSTVWLGACPHGCRISSANECTSAKQSIGLVSSRCLALRVSGSLNADGPQNTSLHGEQDV